MKILVSEGMEVAVPNGLIGYLKKIEIKHGEGIISDGFSINTY